jgi:hypothetical protein
MRGTYRGAHAACGVNIMTIERTKLVDKIKALMAKTTANGCTEQEALAALAKARAMIDAYEISDDELALTREEKAVLHKSGGRDPHSVRRFLASSVARFTGCAAWISRGARSDSNLVFCGLRSDADLAEWLLNHLAQFILVELSNFLCKQIYPKGERRRLINGFVIGATNRIGQRLDALTSASRRNDETRARDPRIADHAPGNRALVLAEIKRDAIKATMAAAGVHLRAGRASSRVSDRGARDAGQAAGDRATFGRPVGSGNLRLR